VFSSCEVVGVLRAESQRHWVYWKCCTHLGALLAGVNLVALLQAADETMRQ
jgi:hypothetical protein